MRAGQPLEAQICCQQALAVDSGHADTLHLMGLLSLQAKQYDHAVEWFALAIRQDPRPEFLSSLGITLQQQGRLEEALKSFDKAVQLRPDDAELWARLGTVLLDLKRPADALLSLQHALNLDPRHLDAAYKSASVFCRLGRFEEALRHCDLCNELQPNNAFVLQMRGTALRGLRRFEEYLADSRLAHTLDPGNIETRNNIGDALQSFGRYEEALPWFDRALELRPRYPIALINKAASLTALRRFDEAIAVYHRVDAIDPGNAEAAWNLSLVQLLTGDFEAGWTGREARWNRKTRQADQPKLSKVMWLGQEAIEGKTILVHADEGLGDTIQFVRYVPMMAERGARVILAVQAPAQALLSDFPGVSECIPMSSPTLPPYDMHCPICSLPLAFGTRLDTIPSEVAYLPAPADSRVQAWKDRLGSHQKLRVGLVWSGNPEHANDRNRSIPLSMFSRLLDVDAIFVSLQKDPRAGDQAVLRERTEIVDLTAGLTDFVETAALISCLDLVITVDTSVAHLAAAHGRPTWILLPNVPDYRWLLDRDDSPWYPTVRLFRQTETREYETVLDRVRNELRSLIPAGSSNEGRESR
jgi:tetratricopeptide (TPR) repeat protein